MYTVESLKDDALPRRSHTAMNGHGVEKEYLHQFPEKYRSKFNKVINREVDRKFQKFL